MANFAWKSVFCFLIKGHILLYRKQTCHWVIFQFSATTNSIYTDLWLWLILYFRMQPIFSCSLINSRKNALVHSSNDIICTIQNSCNVHELWLPECVCAHVYISKHLFNWFYTSPSNKYYQSVKTVNMVVKTTWCWFTFVIMMSISPVLFGYCTYYSDVYYMACPFFLFLLCDS